MTKKDGCARGLVAFSFPVNDSKVRKSRESKGSFELHSRSTFRNYTANIMCLHLLACCERSMCTAGNTHEQITNSQEQPIAKCKSPRIGP